MANTMAAPVANTFATYASKFLPLLDEVYKRESLSAILDTADARVRWIGAKTINVLKLDLNGNANYDRNAGYVPGSATGVWEPLTIEIDRGRSFLLDQMDADEMLLSAAQVLSEHQRVWAIPEEDAYRFAKIAAGADTNNVVSAALTSGFADAIQTAEAALDDAEVPYEGRILFVSPTVYKGLKGDITRFTENGDPDVNGRVEMYDDMRVIRVPQARFNDSITLNAPTTAAAAGGFTAAGNDIHFMLVHPSAVIQVVKHLVPQIFAPTSVFTADGYIINYREYHDTFVLANKKGGIYVHKEA
jgi:hypothetical protein